MRKTFTRRIAAAAGVLGAALMGLTAVGAGAATAGPLPGGFVNKKLVDGTTVQARLYDEFVNYNAGNVANIPTSRAVWVSGKIGVNIGGGAKGASVNGGYVVGCQISLSGIDNNGGASTDGTQAGTSATAGATLHLGPGQAGYVPIIQTTSGDYTTYKNYNVNKFTFTGNHGGVAFSQEQFQVNGCAGYAEARARFDVVVVTDTMLAHVVVWGKPFSIG
ncbi:MspA family porin [Gordonia sp. TBRC 11910]|uniref:MspA family porin n=1 Tax=Gordonia asplenii TaxID=2725283 RepID=A0A848KWL3_9ACTN|nr:MspA family porin [Gordonia asplenii]NMO00561.1 MspA family porin [Gordonia asplenii]